MISVQDFKDAWGLFISLGNPTDTRYVLDDGEIQAAVNFANATAGGLPKNAQLLAAMHFHAFGDAKVSVDNTRTENIYDRYITMVRNGEDDVFWAASTYGIEFLALRRSAPPAPVF